MEENTEKKYHCIKRTSRGYRIEENDQEYSATPWITPFTEAQEKFYEAHPNAFVEEVKSMTMGIANKSIEDFRTDKIEELENYDKSDNVNIFYYNGIAMWFDKATRVGLINSINSAESMEIDTIMLWYNDIKIVFETEKAKNMLAQIELYAMECFNVTESHRSEILKLEDVESILRYNIKTNYPEKLNF